MMPHTIQVKPATGVDAYHKRVYGDAVSYQAAIQGTGGAKVRDQTTGEEKVSRYAIYVAVESHAIKKEDQLILPAPYDPQSPPIIRVDPQDSQGGLHHLVVYT
jgi:hypothetical protein